MRLSLSTNWCSRRLPSGEEIADLALSLGFEALELGYHVTPQQAKGFKARLDRMPVGSVHAFCPVPISAPQGCPELYSLATLDGEARKMALLQVRRTVAFAADMGADAVVLHAGRVAFSSPFDRIDSSVLRAALKQAGGRTEDVSYANLLARARKRRQARGRKMAEAFCGALSSLIPDLERFGVTLALENLPYLEGFPDEGELVRIARALAGAPVKGWYDTGHARVRQMHGWIGSALPEATTLADGTYVGMHLNDVVDFCDDHLAPGEGKVDFAALRPLAEQVRHVVFEPNASVAESSLRAGLALVRRLWRLEPEHAPKGE